MGLSYKGILLQLVRSDSFFQGNFIEYVSKGSNSQLPSRKAVHLISTPARPTIHLNERISINLSFLRSKYPLLTNQI